MLALLLSLTALGAECETPFTLDELRVVVGTALSAIDQGDPATHQRASEELVARIPCIQGQVPATEWADYLVTEALVRYLEKTPGWEKALKTALELSPNHPYIQDFILEDYLEPPDPPGEPVPIPPGHVVVIDGRILTGAVPPLDGLHVVQDLHEGKWRSKVLRGEAFPAEWLQPAAPLDDEPKAPREPRAPREPKVGGLATWGTVGLSGGLGNWSQSSTELDPSVVERQTSGVAISLSSVGQLYFVRPLGVFWVADLQLQDSQSASADPSRQFVPFGKVFGGISLLDKPISLWVGGGYTTVRVQEKGQERPFGMGNYLVGLSFRSQGPIPIDAMAGGGVLPWAYHGVLNAGATIIDLGPVGLRIGVQADFTRAHLGDADLPLGDRMRLARANRWTGGLVVGLAWGRD